MKRKVRQRYLIWLRRPKTIDRTKIEEAIIEQERQGENGIAILIAGSFAIGALAAVIEYTIYGPR